MNFLDLARAIFGLAFVLGLIGLVAWAARRYAPQLIARLNAERTRRDELYGKFMEEISNLFSHAATEEKVDFAQLVGIYALRGRILLQSSDAVAKEADEAIRLMVDMYLAPNRSAANILADARVHDVMRPFAEACRAELSGLR